MIWSQMIPLMLTGGSFSSITRYPFETVVWPLPPGSERTVTPSEERDWIRPITVAGMGVEVRVNWGVIVYANWVGDGVSDGVKLVVGGASGVAESSGMGVCVGTGVNVADG